MSWAFIWVLIPLFGLSIPLAKIIGSYIIKYQKNKLQYGSNNHSSEIFQEMKNSLEHQSSKIEQLQQRIENLEAVIADDTWEEERNIKQKNNIE